MVHLAMPEVSSEITHMSKCTANIDRNTFFGDQKGISFTFAGQCSRIWRRANVISWNTFLIPKSHVPFPLSKDLPWLRTRETLSTCMYCIARFLLPGRERTLLIKMKRRSIPSSTQSFPQCCEVAVPVWYELKSQRRILSAKDTELGTIRGNGQTHY